MRVLTYILTVLSSLLLGAHFLRAENPGLMVVSIAALFLLFIKKRWVLYVLFGLLFFGTIEWLTTAIRLHDIRVAAGLPGGRMLIILGSVAIVTVFTAFLTLLKPMKKAYPTGHHDAALTSSFFIAAILMAIAHIKVNIPVLMVERFFTTFGWLEIFVLALYAVWITNKMLDRSLSSKWRRIIWSIFSIVFFAQLTLGLTGWETFLMTGKLHLPVPAMILAGPLFRGELSFMVYLFLGSMVILGPAWCSHLCYIGVWDDAFSRRRKTPKRLPRYRQWLRIAILILIIAVTLILKFNGVPSFTAGMVGLGFGLLGVGLMTVWSRKTGVMTHCVTYCPIGLLAVVLGKISPFRIRIDNKCTDCAICRPACRYDALNVIDIKRRKPNINCTLCGDCLHKCEDNFIEYRFLGLKANSARIFFIVLAASLHTIFLGLGRI